MITTGRPEPVHDGARTMQWKPMWLMPVSSICACRAAGPVAPAVGGRVEERAALDHAARDADARLRRVEAALHRPTARVDGDVGNRCRELLREVARAHEMIIPCRSRRACRSRGLRQDHSS